MSDEGRPVKIVRCAFCNDFETELYGPKDNSSFEGWERLREHVAGLHPRPWFKLQAKIRGTERAQHLLQVG